MAFLSVRFRYIVLLMFFLILSAVIYVGLKYQQHYSSRFIDIDIKSNALSEMRRVFIRLPKNYNPNKAYPLIIKTDGNFNLDTWDDALSFLESTDDKHEVILVSIPNLFWHDTRNRDLVPPYARKDVAIEARPINQNQREIFGKADVFLKFIETELIPYLEGEYPI
ncbi:alpha/beta hydrolase-fold protein [Pseudoalteromonas sp. XI10]|uniref:alpha/beta hydrolase-fold protein n=1 Tax=Pseudoalteromonas sp. XI10 TaxID=1766621 RepID=UPI000AD8C109|nr:alpha/beta hydrolase-fold protein [Pseudoalteromonas sp. XI10]